MPPSFARRFASLCALSLCAPACSQDANKPPSPGPVASSLSSPGPLQPLSLGQTVPEFQALGQTGYMIRATDLLDLPLAIFFCPRLDQNCIKLALPIRDQWLSLNQQLSMVAFITQSGWNETRNFASQHQLPQLLLSDHDGSITRSFGLTPKTAASHAFLLGKDLEVLQVLSKVDPANAIGPLLTSLPPIPISASSLPSAPPAK